MILKYPPEVVTLFNSIKGESNLKFYDNIIAVICKEFGEKTFTTADINIMKHGKVKDIMQSMKEIYQSGFGNTVPQIETNFKKPTMEITANSEPVKETKPHSILENIKKATDKFKVTPAPIPVKKEQSKPAVKAPESCVQETKSLSKMTEEERLALLMSVICD